MASTQELQPSAPVRVPMLVTEQIGEHEFEGLDMFCFHCGTRLEDAATKPCGPR